METRIFHQLGQTVSEVGLGTWQLGADWGRVEEHTALEILRAAVESGTTLFDTADVYGAGRSETLIGRFLRESKSRIFVATKFGRFSSPGWPANFERAAVRQHAEASLRRLGVEALDLTQLHCLPPAVMAKGEIFEHLRELRREGKIRAFGASVESMEEAELCLRQEGLASLQIIFNVFRQRPLEKILPEAKRNGVAILVRLPLASGLLSGRMSRATRFEPEDHRAYNRDGQAFNVGETFAGLPFEQGVGLADRLKPLVPAGMTMAQWAQRWCLDHDAVTAIIPGATTPDQARANAAASACPALSPEQHAQLAAFYRTEVNPQIRGEQ